MFKSDVIFDTKYWHDERRLNPWNNALNDSLEFHKFHILLNCFVGGIYCWTNERNGMLLKFCLNGASTLGHRTRGKSAKIKWYPQKLFKSNPLLTTLNCFFCNYPTLAYIHCLNPTTHWQTSFNVFILGTGKERRAQWMASSSGPGALLHLYCPRFVLWFNWIEQHEYSTSLSQILNLIISHNLNEIKLN